jgi:hypothetical protein
LQPRHCFLIPTQQYFITVADGFVSIRYAKTPMPKIPEVPRLNVSLNSTHQLSRFVP